MKGKKIINVLAMILLLCMMTSCSINLEQNPNQNNNNNFIQEDNTSVENNKDEFNSSNPISSELDEYEQLLIKHNLSFVGSLYEEGQYTNARQNMRIGYCDNTSQDWKNFNRENITATPFHSIVSSPDELKTAYDRIKTLAEAYSIEGSKWYKDPELLVIIKDSLTFLHENFYYKRYDYSYREQHNILYRGDNWYTWAVDIPLTLMRILPAISTELSEQETIYYVNPILEYANNVNVTEPANLAEVSYIKIICGLLLKDDSLVMQTYSDFERVFNFVSSGNGYYEDGSFVHHGNVAYNGWYGAQVLYSTALITNTLMNSKFTVDFHLETQKKWITDSVLPFMYGDNFHPMVMGRMIKKDINIKFIMGLALMVDYLMDDNITSAYIHIIDSNFNSYSTHEYMVMRTYEKLNVKRSNGYIPNNHFSTYDSIAKSVSYYNGISFGISLSSNSIAKYEAINGENGNGWYLGDGATFTYNNINDYNSSYFKSVNMYRLAGTTVTTIDRISQNSYTSSTLTSNYIGSMSGNNWLVTAFELNGNTNEVYTGLTANKAYLVYEDKLLCIGNSIKSQSYDAFTIIENRRLNGNVYINNQVVDLSVGEHKLDSNYIYIENYGTIYVDDYSNVYYNITENNFIEIYYKHYITDDSNYYYILLPNTELNQANSFVNQFELINNINNNINIKNGLNGNIINIDFNSDNIIIN